MESALNNLSVSEGLSSQNVVNNKEEFYKLCVNHRPPQGRWKKTINEMKYENPDLYQRLKLDMLKDNIEEPLTAKVIQLYITPKKEVKISKNAEYKNEYIKLGNTLGICINMGCNKEVAIRHWNINGKEERYPSEKTECSRCARVRKSNKSITGIEIHKKKYCENKYNILGFKCPMDIDCYHEFPSDCYDMDHKDGDHNNNTLENLITLCKVCHARKGKESGDFNSQKRSSSIHKQK